MHWPRFGTASTNSVALLKFVHVSGSITCKPSSFFMSGAASVRLGDETGLSIGARTSMFLPPAILIHHARESSR